MAQLLPETEATEFEGRYYVNPQTSVDETNSFIDNYRNLQKTNTAKIAADTHNLGTDVPSNIGGLSGSGSYWANRYQTPQTASAVADLRTTAQAAALNTALENEKNAWTKRYNDAYRNYQKRASSGGSGGGGGGQTTIGNVTDEDPSKEEDVSLELTDIPVTYDMDIGTSAGWGELSDLWTGEYNFTLPGGTQLNLGGWDEELKLGSDGNYYVWNKANNTYTMVTLGESGNNSKANGKSRWWTK